jgi:hypothetical protein
MTTFQQQIPIFIFQFFRYGKRPTVPCLSDIMFDRLQAERHFNVVALKMFFVLFFFLPPFVPHAQGPLGLGGDVVAVALCLQGARQIDLVFKTVGGKPFFFFAIVFRIDF